MPAHSTSVVKHFADTIFWLFRHQREDLLKCVTILDFANVFAKSSNPAQSN